MDIVSRYNARRATPYMGLPMECVITVRKYEDGFVPVSDALGMGHTYKDEQTAAYDLARRHGYTIVGKVSPQTRALEWLPGLRYPCGDPEQGPARRVPVGGCMKCGDTEADNYTVLGFCPSCVEQCSHVRAPLDPQCIHCGKRMAMYEVREIALGETQRMATCATASDAILLAKQWRDEWGSRTVALDPDGNVIAEHAAGVPRE